MAIEVPARAVDAFPAYAPTYSQPAFAGYDQEASRHCEKAMRLSPLDPANTLVLGDMALTHYLTGRYAQAVQRTSEALKLRSGFQGARRMLCVSLAHAGRLDKARAQLAQTRKKQPQRSIEWIRWAAALQTPKLMERYLDGMRKAGLE